MKVLSAKFEPQPCLANDFAVTRLICFAAATATACGLQGNPYGGTGSGQALLDTVALVGISIAVWHGAYDGVLARPLLEHRLGSRWALAFAAGYLFLLGATLLAWHLAPAFALVAFLLYSSWHFGTEQYPQPVSLVGAVPAFALGALPISAACYWHSDEVAPIFRSMLGSAANPAFANQLSQAGSALLWVSVVLAAVGASPGLPGRSRSTRLTMLCLVALELLLFRCCDPVVGFAIYFCLWHTPEHLVSTSIDHAGLFTLRVMIRNLRAGAFPWIATLAGLAVLFAFRPMSFAGYTSALFIVLSALTVPHMALNELRRLHKGSDVMAN